MVLVIDNFDSFTYNLVQLLGTLGQEVTVRRNNALTTVEADRLKPDFLVISPGPCTPEKAGISVEMIRHFAGKIPILGVCLGHQAIGAAFGARIIKAARLMHGKNSDVLHDGKTIYSDLPPSFSGTRYHSLTVEAATLPTCLEVSARTAEDEIMGIRHRELEVEGVQFHPESVATPLGRKIIDNFLKRRKTGTTFHIRQAIARASDAQNLESEEMAAVMRFIMAGEATAAQIGAFITALKIKGETAEEIGAAAGIMRAMATRVAVREGRTIVDPCGTGGDGAHTFNISTVAALIAAGAGVTVAKHGNRSVSSRCGSADVLKALGVNIDIGPQGMSRCIEKAGIGFLFAPLLHSAMRHVIGPRREIGIRTLFNILGPLSNPAFAHAQLLGVYDRGLIGVMAEVLKRVGLQRALVVHGSDGLDEITLAGKTYAAELRDGTVTELTIDPGDYSLGYSPSEDLKGGTAQENAGIALDILSGREQGPKRDIALLNAAAAIYVAGEADDLAAALDLARESVASGAAQARLDMLRKVSHGMENGDAGQRRSKL